MNVIKNFAVSIELYYTMFVLDNTLNDYFVNEVV